MRSNIYKIKKKSDTRYNFKKDKVTVHRELILVKCCSISLNKRWNKKRSRTGSYSDHDMQNKSKQSNSILLSSPKCYL